MKTPIITRDSADGASQLHCPSCKEELQVADVEVFQCCPFCGVQLNMDDALEEFLLAPYVQTWIAKTNQNINS